jgi:hypothetical protein
LLLLLAGAPAQAETELMADKATDQAIRLMTEFAQRTGLSSERGVKRYLWTDAFAVCNLLGLARRTRDDHYEDLALRLVDQVHHTLARYGAEDSRRGWISGLDEREAEAHPTRGGLRIGKRLAERGAEEPFDEQLEWERDGQYFHYLAKWMHALDQTARATGEARFNRWARELAQTAHRAFTYRPGPGRAGRMHWKMSIDLSRPLVPSMGQHDPLDGYVTALQLQTTATLLPDPAQGPALGQALGDFAAILEQLELGTRDPLGLGGLLVDAYRLQQLRREGASFPDALLERLLAAALGGLTYYAGSGELQAPAEYRLAFRELGLALGIQAVERMWDDMDAGAKPQTRTRDLLQALRQYTPLGASIEAFWRRAEHRTTSLWLEHQDINEVMLATALAPGGCLTLLSPSPSRQRP